MGAANAGVSTGRISVGHYLVQLPEEGSMLLSA